jgi:hypothetical protein
MNMSDWDTCFFVGLDFGQAQDYTALVVLDRPRATVYDPPDKRRPSYALRHLHRFPLGTPYPEVVEEIRRLLKTPELNHCVLTVDQTGVGSAVVDMLYDGLNGHVNCRFNRVTITAGHETAVGEQGVLLVPKKELVSALQVLLQSRRLSIASALPDTALLVKELETFKAKITLARPDALEDWREGPHDDLVLATALAAWVGEKALPGLYEQPPDTRLERIILA